MKPDECRRPPAGGYTMIELMIVIGIIGMFAAIGIPSMVRAMEKGPLRQALSDIVDGCAQARADAILKGTPMAFVIRAEDGSMSVRAAPSTAGSGSSSGAYGGGGGSGGLGGGMGGLYAPTATGGGTSSGKTRAFSGSLHDDIAVEKLMINLRDAMDAEEAVVRFYPNGVSDEMMMEISLLLTERHRITLDPIVGLPEIEKIQ